MSTIRGIEVVQTTISDPPQARGVKAEREIGEGKP